MKRLSILLVLLFASVAQAQLTTYPDQERLCGLVKSEVAGQWTVFAKDFLEVKPTILDAEDGSGVGKLCMIQGPPGTYGVVFFSGSDKPPLVTRIVLSNIGPAPKPDPGPDPEPDPGPDPEPSGKYDIMMFYAKEQLRDMPKEQNAVLNGLKLRTELEAAGHTIVEVLEDDVFTEGLAEEWKPFAEAIKGQPLPIVVLRDKETKAITFFPLPASPDAMKEKLK
jgi:hypothetical protein